MTSLKSIVLSSALLAICPLASLCGGTPEVASSKEVIPSSNIKSAWEITIRPYGWLAGMEGTTGIRGYTAETDVAFEDILNNLDMTAALQMEVKHGRWMLLLDGMYLELSAGDDAPGRLLSNANIELTQIMAEAAIGYRLWEGERGYLDLYAGARYMRLDGDIGFEVDSAGVRSLSQDISEKAVTQITSAVRSTVSEVAVEVKSQARQKITAAAETLVNQKISQALENHPNLPKAIDFIRNSSGPVSESVRDLVAARIAEQQADLAVIQEAASAKVSAAKARALEKARRAVTRAEKKLAQRIEQQIEDSIPESVSGSADWVDPIVGFRGQFHFTDRLFAVGRADVGGFGVGSDLAWQAYAGLGWQASSHVSLEMGYRCLDMDYTSGGFTFDTMTSGVIVSLAFKF
ncbi:hypothetical protein FEM03_13250 [Phragmitibacter flavus]|uniref:Outer membrane protein beta-barrel domain-containing protein n=1 Tax=Phragmitibacter flavus TaxID=2576071 RepID=A0A5R8KDY8_9BACT|nr:hypothetical protein [Phragmitibacter flavus]TLD70155.1 hypothetical protein FEM03_13250 [Phragmitibacter flavus]